MNYTNYDQDYVDVNFVDTSREIIYICRLCQQLFYFNNKLHRHVKKCRKIQINDVDAHVTKIKFKNKIIQIAL